LIDYFMKGGALMWPIALCSVLSWAIMIERAVRLRRGRLIDDDLVHQIRAALGRGDLAGAERTAAASPVLVGRVLARGLDEYRYTEADIETALQGAAERQLQVLWRYMGALNTIARVGTMLGLLGTVVGMVLGFEELTQGGVAKEKLAAAIGVALITTVGGLCVAIPAIIGESVLKGKIKHLTMEFEEVLLESVKAARIGGIRKAPLADGGSDDARIERQATRPVGGVVP
jgi:biopolymer transport protein ExbB